MVLLDEQSATGRSADDNYLEYGLPEFMKESIQEMAEV